MPVEASEWIGAASLVAAVLLLIVYKVVRSARLHMAADHERRRDELRGRGA